MAGGVPPSGAGRRALDIVMTPAAPLPLAMRAAIGAEVNGDVLAMQRGMREADRSPRPSGSVAVAQAGGSDAATLPRAGGQPAGANGSAGPAPDGRPSAPPAAAVEAVQSEPPTTSIAGRSFIEKEEELPGVSNTPHHPSAASGVTLGPGYDMKEKPPARIIADLERIGVAPEVAEQISKAATLSGAAADRFIENNKSLINLSFDQQARLLALTIGPYEDKVRRDITAPLEPAEFNALVSFLYNPGHGWPAVRAAVNSPRNETTHQVRRQGAAGLGEETAGGSQPAADRPMWDQGMRIMLRLLTALAVLAHPVRRMAAERCNDLHEVVTGVLLKGLCSSGFVTRSGVTWIDRTTVYNGYPYKLGNTMLLKIPQNGRSDEITYDGDPDVAIGIRMSIGLLAADCYHHHGEFC